jgi:hypothetical protein
MAATMADLTAALRADPMGAKLVASKGAPTVVGSVELTEEQWVDR